MKAKPKTTEAKSKLTTKETKSLQSISDLKVKTYIQPHEVSPYTKYSTEFKENLMAQF